MEKWVYFLNHAAELDPSDIERLFKEPAFVEAGGSLEMISKTPEERLRYELRLKAHRDRVTNLEAAKREGIAVGREEGRWIGRIETLQELLEDAVSTSEELGALDLDRLRQLAESLQTRLRGRAQT